MGELLFLYRKLTGTMPRSPVFDPKNTISNGPVNSSLNLPHFCVRPFTLILAIFGCGISSPTNKYFYYFYNIYSIIIFLVCLVLPLRVLVLIDWNVSVSMLEESLRRTVLVWSMQCFLAGISSAYIIRRGKLMKLFEMWNNYNVDRIIIMAGLEKRCRRKIFIVGTLGCIYLSIQIISALIAFIVIFPNPAFPLTIFGPVKYQRLCVFCIIINYVFWVMNKFLFISVIMNISMAWESFGKCIELKTNEMKFYTETLCWTAKTHQNLLELVDYISGMFGFYTLSQLAFSVPTVVFQSYVISLSLFDNTQMLLLKCMILMWAFAALIGIGAIFYGATVNGVASEVTNIFYKMFISCCLESSKVDRKAISENEIEQQSAMNVRKAGIILNRFQTIDVGVTVMNLVPITKAFALTITSVVFNYFFLLVQFAQQAPANVNCGVQGASNFTNSSGFG